MGGNALSYTTVRLLGRSFHRLASECVGKLQALMPNNKMVAIEAYRSKYDFGDLDILVESTDYDPFKAAEALGAVEVVRNGPVTSIGILVRPELPQFLDGNVFQVDLVAIDAESFDYAKGYFAFNDLGNLIGRTAHAAGLAHRHDGLYYYCREGTYLFKEICLTKDYDRALEFLGYSAERFHQGFEDLEDIFQYVATSTYFNRDIFLLQNRNAKSRIRDRKRKTYMAFLDWCEARPNLPGFAYPEHKSAWLPRIAEHFPHFQGEYDAAYAELARHKAVQAKFNGELVSQWTGHTGKELGQVMRVFKDSFPSREAMQEYILTATEDALKAHVRAFQLAA